MALFLRSRYGYSEFSGYENNMKTDGKTSPIFLWPELTSLETEGESILDENGWYRDVVNPLILPFLPDAEKANGSCILISPGGSYRILDWVSHVERLADLFTPLGYAVVGLKYRVSEREDSSGHALADLHRAIEVIHNHADDWKIDRSRLIGLGYSAGSNLLLRHACARSDDDAKGLSEPPRLPFIALLCCWPHQREPESYNISPKTSAVFFCTTDEDKVAPTLFSESIAEKMDNEGVQVTIKSFPQGGHLAFNFGEQGPAVDWTPAFFAWLRDHDLA